MGVDFPADVYSACSAALCISFHSGIGAIVLNLVNSSQCDNIIRFACFIIKLVKSIFSRHDARKLPCIDNTC